MKCPHCGQDHPNQTLTCPVTGGRIAAYECPHCGQVVMAGSATCPYCNTPLILPGQRRNNFWRWIAVGMLATLVVIVAGVLLLRSGALLPAAPATGRPTLAAVQGSATPPALPTSPTPSASITPTRLLTANAVAPPPCTKPGQTWLRPSDGMEMLCIPAGSFQIGMRECTFNGCGGEVNGGRVTLEAYWIDRSEVTNRMFAHFVEQSGYLTGPERSGASEVNGTPQPVRAASWRQPQGPGSSITALQDHPVVQIDWEAANAYCRWSGARLPSEAQWEFAARGDDHRLFPWGNEMPRDLYLNAADSNLPAAWARADQNDGYRYTAPVGSYPAGASPFGVQDMAGNVWEWTRSLLKPYPYSANDGRELNEDRSTPARGERVALRGGGWYDDYGSVRSTLRFGAQPDLTQDAIGFRCAAP